MVSLSLSLSLTTAPRQMLAHLQLAKGEKYQPKRIKFLHAGSYEEQALSADLIFFF